MVLPRPKQEESQLKTKKKTQIFSLKSKVIYPGLQAGPRIIAKIQEKCTKIEKLEAGIQMRKIVKVAVLDWVQD